MEFDWLFRVFREKYSLFSSLIFSYASFSFSNKISTAAVTFSKDSGRFISFLFNPDFYAKLNRYEIEFVVAHECLHIFFEHGLRGINVNDSRSNIAMDIVINEALVNHYGYSREKLDNIQPHFIDNTFTESVLSDMSFEYYLNKLDENVKYIEIDSHMFVSKSGELSNKIKDFDKAFNPFQLEKMSKISGNMSRLQDIKEKLRIRVNKKLAKIVTKMTKIAINEHESSQWILPNRRLSEVDFLLPQSGEVNCKSKSTVHIAFFADVSGSCVSYAKTFYNTLFSLPSKVICDHYVFDTDYIKIKKGDSMKSGGGTDFNVIQNVLSKYKKYPDLVFVLTDGYAEPIVPKYPERWHVFITSGGRENSFIGVKNKYKYEDFS